MLTSETTYDEIANLVKKFKAISASKRKAMNENATRQSYILPLFLALAEKGHGKSEAYYRVAQAISETLPNESKGKKLLDVYLAGRERIQDAVEKEGRQEKLL